jgi:hypothetical protein
MNICSACKSLDTTPTQLRLCGCQCHDAVGPTYYAIAHVPGQPDGVTGILAVTKTPGSRSVQDWAGETFPTWEEAEAEMVAKNRALLAGRSL